jgi:hypothetical protein
MPAHTCHAINCYTPVPPQMLMCKRHWYMVPKSIREAVWANYRVGQCDDKAPSYAWRDAAYDAILSVRKQEILELTKDL